MFEKILLYIYFFIVGLFAPALCCENEMLLCSSGSDERAQGLSLGEQLQLCFFFTFILPVNGYKCKLQSLNTA